jgi:cbb3-type cytochrome oxidase subunit 3
MAESEGRIRRDAEKVIEFKDEEQDEKKSK